MLAEKTVQDYWNEPYYDGLADGQYTAIVSDFHEKVLDDGREIFTIKYRIMDGDFEGAPAEQSIWPNTKPGTDQIKGILKRINPAYIGPDNKVVFGTINEGINAMKAGLHGALCAITQKTTSKDGKEYKNIYLNEIMGKAQAGLNQPIAEEELPF